MGRKKENIDAYGKSWKPVDIPNLEKAVKLMERLNYLQGNFADSMSKANQIEEWINEQQQVSNDLRAMNIKLTKEQCQHVIALSKEQTKSNNQAIEASKIAQQAMSNSSSRPSYSLSNIGDAFKLNRLENDAQRALKNAAISAGKKHLDKNSSAYSDYINKYATDQLAKSANKYNVAASVIQLAANTFSSAVSTFTRLFKGGYDNQRNAYENTFTNISVRNGTTRSDYLRSQAGTNNILRSAGAFNNVKTSQVQEMWNNLASKGLNVDLSEAKRAQTIANAIDTVITNTIVPYLDTSSSYFQLLTQQQPTLMKQIRGIGIATQEINGSSVFANKYLQDMIDNLSPMASLAKNQLGIQYAKMSGVYENLRAQNISDATIGELFRGAASLYNDPLAALRSNSLDLKLAAASGISRGIDFRDISAVNREYLLSSNYISNWVPEGNMSPIFAGMLNTSLGITGKTELNNRNINMMKAIQAGNQVAANLDTAALKATSDFIGDKNQTKKSLQETTMENLANEVAAIYEAMGYWGDVIVGLLKAIGGLIATSIGSNMIGGLMKGTAGKGAGKFLGHLGAGLATKGVASTGAGLAVAGGAAAGIGMAGYGGYQAYKDFSSGDIAGGSMAATGAVGGAVGAGALIALGASNPVGWVALAVGGIALVGRHFYKLASETGDITEELKKQNNQVIKSYRLENEQKMDNLYQLRESIKTETDIDKQKQLLVTAGIATQKELDDAQYDSKEALIALTDQYIASTKKLNTSGEELLKYIQTNQSKDQNQISKNMYSLFDKKYKDMSKQDKAVAAAFGNDYYQYMLQLSSEGNKDAAWRLEEWEKKGVDLTDDIFSEADLKAIMKAGSNSTSQALFKRFFTDQNRVSGLTLNPIIQSYLGRDSSFKPINEEAINYITQALGASDKEKALALLLQAKQMGLSYDLLNSDIKGQLLDKWDISSYRTGKDYIPYDNYIASLHEGEAVLTASTAGELRNLITTYRESVGQSVILDAAITNQTTILVSKIDEVIRSVQSLGGIKGISNWSSDLGKNMQRMTSTKIFG